MIINNFSQIENLFINQTPEGQSLDYKAELYKIQRSQIPSGSKIKSRDEQVEFLKDVCAFLNSEGGTIILGIRENKEGAPRGEIKSEGLPLTDFPARYDELLGQLSLTHITPIPFIKIELIKNGHNPSLYFIVINVSLQNYPLFTVIKDKNASDVNNLFVRRGRNIGFLSVKEIEERINNFSKFSNITEIVNSIKKKNTNWQSQFKPVLIIVSKPVSVDMHIDVLHQEWTEKLLRYKNDWEIGDFTVSLEAIDLFPTPTFYGIKIEVPDLSLEICEDGSVIFIMELKEDRHLKKSYFLDKMGIFTTKEWFILHPQPVKEIVFNYFRKILEFYNKIGFIGQTNIEINLLNLQKNNIYAFRTIGGVSTVKGMTQADGKYVFSESEFNSYYGPHESELNNIEIELKIDSYNYKKDTLNECDEMVKHAVLDYIWRAFNFESFPS